MRGAIWDKVHLMAPQSRYGENSFYCEKLFSIHVACCKREKWKTVFLTHIGWGLAIEWTLYRSRFVNKCWLNRTSPLMDFESIIIIIIIIIMDRKSAARSCSRLRGYHKSILLWLFVSKILMDYLQRRSVFRQNAFFFSHVVCKTHIGIPMRDTHKPIMADTQSELKHYHFAKRTIQRKYYIPECFETEQQSYISLHWYFQSHLLAWGGVLYTDMGISVKERKTWPRPSAYWMICPSSTFY